MFDPESFAKLAERLVANPCGHEDARTAIGRAYYSAFLVSRTLLERFFIFSGTAESHTQVQLLLINCGKSEVADLGRFLNDLRDRRNEADYDMHNTDVNSYHRARQFNEVSKEVRDGIRDLVKCGDNNPIIDAMKKWAEVTKKVRTRTAK